MKRLIVFAGPNGSGKSTIISKQRTIPDFPQKYVCPDITVKKYSYISDEKERYSTAMAACEKLRYSYVNMGISFAFETVFSSKNKLDFLVYARENGYIVEGIYVTTKNPSINIERVRQRVESGGHDVPEEKIISRYQKSMALLPDIIQTCNSITIIDNSSVPVMVFLKHDNELCLLNREKRTDDWINEYIINPLINSGTVSLSDIKDLTEAETEEYFNCTN